MPKYTEIQEKLRNKSGAEAPLLLLIYSSFWLFAIVAGPCRDLFAAVGAVAGNDELNASAVSTVAARLMTRLAVVNRIGMNVVFRALARRVATLSPLIDRIETRAAV